MSQSINWSAVGAVIIPNIGGLACARITKYYINPWYYFLKRPKWIPLNWTSAPSRIGLYSSLGYASYLVYRDGGGIYGEAQLPLLLYGSNLILNWTWPLIFFKKRNLKLTFFEIQLVTLTAAGTGFLFYKINRTAGLIFLPYVLWMGLISSVSYKIYKDNKASNSKKKYEKNCTFRKSKPKYKFK